MSNENTVNKHTEMLCHRFGTVKESLGSHDAEFNKKDFRTIFTGTPKFFETLLAEGMIIELTEKQGYFRFATPEEKWFNLVDCKKIAKKIAINQKAYLKKLEDKKKPLKDFTVSQLVAELKTRGDFKVVQYVKTEKEL